jgi:hypothetical protein
LGVDDYGARFLLGSGGNEPVSAARDRLDETWALRVVLQGLADLADSAINAVVRIKEHILAPNPLGDFVASDELPTALDEEQKDFGGDALQFGQLYS